MKIQNEVSENHGSFYIEEVKERIAEMVYELRNDRIIIEHTNVSDKFSGKGLGKQLVESAVEYARKNKLKIVPLCSFVKSFFDKNKGYEDVL